MKVLLNRDIATGMLVLILGAGTALYASSQYAMGSFRSPGPGLFPTLVAAVLALVGVGLLIQALFQRKAEALTRFELRPFVVILLAIAAFAVVFSQSGYGPAVFVLAFVCSYSDDALNWRQKLGLAAVITVMAVVLFRFALGLRLPVIAQGWW